MTTTITNVRVSFRRSKQPQQYEASEPVVELNASVEDGESAVSAAAKLMRDAATVVYRTLGLKEAEDRIAMAFDDLIEGDYEVEVDGQTVSGKAETASAVAANPTKRTRRTKAQMEADKASSAVTTQASASSAIPATEIAAIASQSTTPSQPTAQAEVAAAPPAPAQNTAPVVAETPATEVVLSDLDQAALDIINSPIAMQKWVSGYINTKKLGVEQYRGIVSEVSAGKALKTVDLTVEQRTDAYKKVMDIVNAGAAPAPKAVEIDI